LIILLTPWARRASQKIIQGTGLIRNTAEQAIFRAVQSEQIERTAPGTYRLAPPKPLPSSCNGHSNEEWVARIEAWQANPASWRVEEDGPPPNDPNHRIPLDVVGRLKMGRVRDRGGRLSDMVNLSRAKDAAGIVALGILNRPRAIALPTAEHGKLSRQKRAGRFG
jgi:hypothetical protein